MTKFNQLSSGELIRIRFCSVKMSVIKIESHMRLIVRLHKIRPNQTPWWHSQQVGATGSVPSRHWEQLPRPPSHEECSAWLWKMKAIDIDLSKWWWGRLTLWKLPSKTQIVQVRTELWPSIFEWCPVLSDYTLSMRQLLSQWQLQWINCE